MLWTILMVHLMILRTFDEDRKFWVLDIPQKKIKAIQSIFGAFPKKEKLVHVWYLIMVGSDGSRILYSGTIIIYACLDFFLEEDDFLCMFRLTVRVSKLRRMSKIFDKNYTFELKQRDSDELTLIQTYTVKYIYLF
jgi:hypothetical protein